MFTSIEVSLVRERNERLRREVDTDRIGGSLRAGRGSWTGSHRTARDSWPRRFASLSGRLWRAGMKGVGGA